MENGSANQYESNEPEETQTEVNTYQTLEQAFTSGRATRDHIPYPVLELGKLKLLRHLLGTHG